jgi:hypothetical protein
MNCGTASSDDAQRSNPGATAMMKLLLAVGFFHAVTFDLG